MELQTKKLKIAVFAGRFPCISEAFILNQIIYFKEQGHSVDIYVYDRDKEPIHPSILKYNLLNRTIYQYQPNSFSEKLRLICSMFYKSNKRLTLLSTLNFFKFGKSALSFDIFFKCLAFLDAPNYDIIHAHYGTRGTDVVSIKEAGFLKNIPLITTFHGFDINPLDTAYNKRKYRKLFEKSSLITANSNYTLDLIIKAGCPKHKVVKLPMSLDTTFFRKLTRSTNHPTKVNIAFCGRFVGFKAPDLVVEIAKQLIIDKGYKNISFHLVGSGEMLHELENRIFNYKLSNAIFLYGPMVQERIIELLSEMDIFLYPGINDSISGRAENQGLVLQEAQSLELPVITSDVGGIPEGVINKKTGFVLTEKDIAAFVEKIELLMASPELRTEMGKKGREYVVNNFDNKVLCKKLEGFYYSIVTMLD